LLDSFGGERGKIAGRLDALRYGKVWVVIQKPVASEAPVPAPSAGRAIDHVGWRVANLDATSVELKDKGVKFTTEPQAVGAVKTAFVEAPNGLRIELLQR
jgi:catechol 2,3-dioxygenase-like lactoylglutathione lyase family enzyme